MSVFATQLEGDRMILLEAGTSDTYSKSDLEFRPNPMAALERSMDAIGDVGRVVASRVRLDLHGTGVELADVSFGIRVDSLGTVMIAQQGENAQFTVKLSVRVG